MGERYKGDDIIAALCYNISHNVVYGTYLAVMDVH
jgi:hypothetical protein